MNSTSHDEHFALSFAQQRLWFLDQLNGIGASYNLPFGLRLRGPLNIATWRRSLDQIFIRHEALRSIFVAVDGMPHVELLAPETGFPLTEYDLQNDPDCAASLERLCKKEAHTLFDLARGPLVRACLVRISAQEHIFVLTQHHIVSDGWSIGVFIHELNILYKSFLEGHDNPLPPLLIQYQDYADWQRQWLSAERLKAQVAYWRETLTNAPVLLELPIDRLRPSTQIFLGSALPVHIDSDLTHSLKRLSQQSNVTLFMTVLAAWAMVLSRLSGQDDLIIGIPTANRRRPEIEGLIGFFVNTLALRLNLADTPSVAELLGRVRRTSLAAQDNQDLPFEQVVEIVRPPRHLNHTPLFQVMFAWQNNTVGGLNLPNLKVENFGYSFNQAKFDLELSLYEADDSIIGELRYATAIFDADTIDRHRSYLISVLKSMSNRICR